MSNNVSINGVWYDPDKCEKVAGQWKLKSTKVAEPVKIEIVEEIKKVQEKPEVKPIKRRRRRKKTD